MPMLTHEGTRCLLVGTCENNELTFRWVHLIVEEPTPEECHFQDKGVKRVQGSATVHRRRAVR